MKVKLAPWGFKFQSARRSFISKSKDHTLAFHLAFIQYPDDFDVVANLGIRLNAVHDLADPQGDEIGTYTFGIEIGNLTEGRQCRWTVNSDASAASVADELESVFKEIAMPYYQKYTDMQAAYDLLTSTGYAHCSIKSKRDCVVETLKSLLAI